MVLTVRFLIVFFSILWSIFCLIHPSYWLNYDLQLLRDPKIRQAILSIPNFDHSLFGKMGIVVWMVAIYFLWQGITDISVHFSVSVQKIRSAIKNVFSDVWFIIYLCCLIFFVAILYLNNYVPVTIDEAFSYVYLSSKGVLTCLMYYPGPNHHPLYNCFVSILVKIGLPTVVSIRGVSLLAGIVWVVVMYAFFKKNYNKVVAITIISISMCSFNMMYAFMTGRGYMLQLTLLTCMAICMYTLYKHRSASTAKVGYVMFGVLSIITIPTSVIPILSMLIIGMILFNDDLYNWLKSNVLIALWSIIFYIPMLIFQRQRFLTGNGWYAYQQAKGETYFIELSRWMWEVPFGWLVMILLLIIACVFCFKRYQERVIWVSLLLVPFVLFEFMNVWPFYRIWLYFIPVFILTLVVYINSVVSRSYIYYLLIAVSIVWSSYAWNTNEHDAHRQQYAIWKKHIQEKGTCHPSSSSDVCRVLKAYYQLQQ